MYSSNSSRRKPNESSTMRSLAATSSTSSPSHNAARHQSSTSTAAASSNATTAATTTHNNIQQDKYDRFEQWLRENGARFDNLELCEYDDSPNDNTTSSDSQQQPQLFHNEEKKESTQSPLDDTINTSDFRGVHAKAYLPPNTICMSIPRRCLITVEMGQATPIGQLVLQSDLDLDAPKHIFLMVYLLWDRKVNGRNSFFWPYYEILPQTLRNMPIFWSQDELDELQGSHLLQQIHDRNQAIAEDYFSICQVAPQLAQIASLKEFKWARMCVCSRNFGLVVDGHRTSALVPHADMLNHFRPRQTKWTFDEDKQAFTITTLQPILSGAQVYDSYGQKCNHRFLLNYGFAIEDNCELDGFCPNEVPLELFVDPHDDLFAEKLEFWTRGDAPQANGGGGQQQSQSQHHDSMYSSRVMPVVKRVRVCVSNNENTRLLFSLLRTLACNRSELEALMVPFRTTLNRQPGSNNNMHPFDVAAARNNSGGNHHTETTRSLFGLPELPNQLLQQYRGVGVGGGQLFTPSSITPISYHRSCRDIRHPISLDNERATMRLLLDLIQRHLAQYPTSLSQDLANLKDPKSRKYLPYSNKRHALIQVKGEKQVLHHYAHWARVALDVLDVIDEELKEERGSVEVQLTPHGQLQTQERPSFESIIHEMEDQVERETEHHTVLRYCADVLGSLRREEFKSIRKARVQRFASSSSARTSRDGSGGGSMRGGY